MNIHVSSIAPHYRITDTMWQDFVWDPVLASKVLLGFNFDVFQRVRMKLYWYHQEVCDSSGFSSGKTIVDWAFCALRNMLFPNQHGAIYYYTFDQGKKTFWKYFKECKSKIFHAHLGELDEKGEEVGSGKKLGASGYTAIYRTGGSLTMPAPSFSKDAATQAGTRYNFSIFEEWTHIDVASDGIDKQLIGRNTEASWNQSHPIWGNRLIFSATGKTRMHPAWKRYAGLKRRYDAGDPRVALIAFSYKDYSDYINPRTGNTFKKDYRNQAIIDATRSNLDKAEFLGEGLGIWSASGKGWFTEEALLQCVANGRARNLTPVISRAQMEALQMTE